MTLATTIIALLLARLPASVEIAAHAVIQGVPVDLALAVHDQETGRVPESRRDTVCGSDGVGRMQVNPSTWWRPLGYRSRAAAVRGLQDRHANIRAGVAILAVCVRVCGLQDAAECYNAGHVGTEKGRRYAEAVRARVRRMHESTRGW